MTDFMKANKKSWIFLFLANSLAYCTYAQSLSQTYQLGKEAYEQGSYEQAVSYYNRVLYFDKQQEYTQRVFADLAVSHFALEEYERSAYFYDIAYNLESESVATQNELLLKRAMCYIYLESYNQALLDLYLVSNDDPLVYRQAALLEGVCLYRLEKFDEARAAFDRAVPPSSEATIITSKFAQLKKINRKSPTKAKILSILIPGTGLMYVGDWKNGISSFVLVGGLATLMVLSTVNTGLLNAFLNVFPWYQRYFMGGYTLSERVAEEKLDTKRLKLLQKIVNELSRAN